LTAAEAWSPRRWRAPRKPPMAEAPALEEPRCSSRVCVRPRAARNQLLSACDRQRPSLADMQAASLVIHVHSNGTAADVGLGLEGLPRWSVAITRPLDLFVRRLLDLLSVAPAKVLLATSLVDPAAAELLTALRAALPAAQVSLGKISTQAAVAVAAATRAAIVVDGSAAVAVCEFAPIVASVSLLNVEDEGPELGVATAILLALQACPIDYRVEAAEHICVVDKSLRDLVDRGALLRVAEAQFAALTAVASRAKFLRFGVDNVAWAGASVASALLKTWVWQRGAPEEGAFEAEWARSTPPVEDEDWWPQQTRVVRTVQDDALALKNRWR
jgi:hypothetical protein